MRVDRMAICTSVEPVSATTMMSANGRMLSWVAGNVFSALRTIMATAAYRSVDSSAEASTLSRALRGDVVFDNLLQIFEDFRSVVFAKCQQKDRGFFGSSQFPYGHELCLSESESVFLFDMHL